MTLTYSGPYTASYGMTPIAVTSSYHPVTAKYDRADFASLASVSTIDELVASYRTEESVNNYVPAQPIASSALKVMTTPETLAEFAKSNLLLEKDIKGKFAALDPKLTSKEAKLYGFFLAVKAGS